MTKTYFWIFCVAIGLWLAGCGDNTSADDPCYVPPSSTVGYTSCTATCVASCGYLPADGSPGKLLPAGCMMQIGTSDTHAVECKASCNDCTP